MKFRLIKILVAVAIVAAVVIGIKAKKGKTVKYDAGAYYKVRSGPLVISVSESGTIKARDQVVIKSELEGRNAILSLVPEGTQVKKGDLLVELDASSLVDNKVDQEIRVQNAEASYIQAKEQLAVTENQAESDLDKAQLTLDFANQDLTKYIEGEYPNQLKESEAKITLAKEELTRAEEKYKWSEKLYNEKYISQTEVQADELAMKRKKLDLELANNSLNLLKEFTYKRRLAELESDVRQAKMALERAERKAKADVIKDKANLVAKESEYNRQKDKLAKLVAQIAKATIHAPTDGFVIYATSGGGRRWSRSEPISEGQEVQEREEILYLPTADSVKAEVDIHEASLQKVDVGLPVRVQVDALPGKIFAGTVASIAQLPDAQSMWLNPDLKVYPSEVFIDGGSTGLRSGMSCRAEIIVEEYDDVMYVPVQSVVRVGGKPTVYVRNSSKSEPRTVEVGLDNNRMIHIISGLEPGEEVMLAPPLDKSEVTVGSDALKPASGKAGTSDKSENAGEKPAGKKTNGAGNGKKPSAAEIEKHRKAMENMTDEQKKQYMQKLMKQAGGNAGGSRSGRGSGGGQ